MAHSVRIDGAVDAPVSYDDQKRIARTGSTAQRCRLAARGDVRPEILYYLAGDPDPGVRRCIAQNGAAPRHADLLLASDEDDGVRSELADKIAHATVSMPDDDAGNVYRITMRALEVLASDQIVRVRQILADTLKDDAGAPPQVMERLALDECIDVAGPVLECSPVLSDEFLVGVLNSEPVQEALMAISRRVALGEEVADAIVNTGDEEAIAELLGNRSAQIREETLDRIVDEAAGHPSWHNPLVRRPTLHRVAARRIAEIVAGPILAELKRRADLDDDTIAAIDEVVQRRLDEGQIDDLAELWESGPRIPVPDSALEWESRSSAHNAVPAGPDWVPWDEPTAPQGDAESLRVHQLHAAGELDERRISDALADNQTEFVVHALAIRAGVAPEVVRRATSLHNVKAIVALAWRADLSMRLATRLQMQLLGVPPSSVLRASASDGYPMSADEMVWQLEFVAGMPGTA